MSDASRLSYVQTSEDAPHCFAQANVQVANLTVVRHDDGEVELVITPANSAVITFRFAAHQVNQLVGAMSDVPPTELGADTKTQQSSEEYGKPRMIDPTPAQLADSLWPYIWVRISELLSRSPKAKP